MPHSVTSQASPGADSPAESVPIKEEPSTQSQDVVMEDADTAETEQKDKVNLEELFDDEDSDQEFSSSAQTASQNEIPVQAM
jgi:DNA primase small subunit